MSLSLLAVSATLAIASPMPSVATGQMLPAGASKASPGRACPMMLLLESTDEIHYVVAFGAEAASTAAFQMTLYARHAVYTVSLPRVVMATPVRPENSGRHRLSTN